MRGTTKVPRSKRLIFFAKQPASAPHMLRIVPLLYPVLAAHTSIFSMDFDSNGRCMGCARHYRGTPLIRNRLPLGAYSRPMPRDLWWSSGVGVSHVRGIPVAREPRGKGLAHSAGYREPTLPNIRS